MNPTFDLFKIDNKKSKGQKNEGLAAEDTFFANMLYRTP